jgi:hypothetical protein
MYSVLFQHGLYLEKKHRIFQRLSNWGVLQDEGLFVLGLLFEKQEWVDLALTRLGRNLENSVLSDGSHWEQSPMYTGEVLSCFLEVVNLCSMHALPLDEGFVSRIHSMATAFSYFLKSDGKLYLFGDTDDIDGRDLVAFASLVFSNPYLKAIAQDQGFERYAFVCTKSQIASYDTLPVIEDKKSKALGDSGNYFLKQDKMEIHFTCGTLGSGHGHADLLHLDVAYDKQDILVDSGRYTYKETPLRLALKGAKAHNTLILDDQLFSEPLGTWQYGPLALPVKTGFAFKGNFDYASGAHLGYLYKKGTYIERKIVRLGTHLIVILDSLHSREDEKHEVSINHHFAPGFMLAKTDWGLRAEKGNLTVSLFSPLADSLAITEYPYSPRYNELERAQVGTVVKSYVGHILIPTILAIGEESLAPEVTILPVMFAGKEREVPHSIGLEISFCNEHYTLVSCDEEVIGEVDLLRCGEIEGYGRLLVRANGQNHCFLW